MHHPLLGLAVIGAVVVAGCFAPRCICASVADYGPIIAGYHRLASDFLDDHPRLGRGSTAFDAINHMQSIIAYGNLIGRGARDQFAVRQAAEYDAIRALIADESVDPEEPLQRLRRMYDVVCTNVVAAEQIAGLYRRPLQLLQELGVSVPPALFQQLAELKVDKFHDKRRYYGLLDAFRNRSDDEWLGGAQWDQLFDDCSARIDELSLATWQFHQGVDAKLQRWMEGMWQQALDDSFY